MHKDSKVKWGEEKCMLIFVSFIASVISIFINKKIESNLPVLTFFKVYCYVIDIKYWDVVIL